MLRIWLTLLLALGGITACSEPASPRAEPMAWSDDAWIVGDVVTQVSSTVMDSGATGGGVEPGGDPQWMTAWQSSSGVGLTVPGPQNTGKFRALLTSGQVPAPGDFSMAGWLNEHHARLPAAQADHPVDLHPIASLQVSPQGQGEVLLQLGVNTAKSLQDLQPSVAMVFLVDKSGSLGLQAWQAIQTQLPELAQHLPAGSWLAVVAFSSGVEVVRPMAAWQDGAAKTLAKQLGDLPMGEGTDLYGGVEAALKQLQLAPKEIAQRRVLLISDGAITKGDHTPEEVVALAKASQVSISTVAYGVQAQLLLLDALASETNGTAYSAGNAKELLEVFAKHAATLLVAVAENFAVTVDMTAGWTLQNDFGLPVKTKGQALQLGRFDDEPPSNEDATSGAADVSGPDAAQAGGTNKALAGALYPADHTGLVVLRLQPPATQAYQPGLELQAATVTWSYALAKDHKPLSHTAKVQFQGLVAIPDGGYEVFSHPEARRVNALVRVGEALLLACEAAKQGKTTEALNLLEQHLDLVAATVASLDVSVDDPNGDLEDAAAVLQHLRDNLAAPLP